METKIELSLLDTTEVAIFVLTLTIILGLVFHLKVFWPLRQTSATIMTVLISVGMAFCILSNFNQVVIGLLLLTQFYRIFSFLRVVKNRINPDALRARSFRSEVFFSAYTVILLVSQQTFADKAGSYQVLISLSLAQFIASLLFIRQVLISRKSTFVHLSDKRTPDIKLPSITVAVPARNETLELTDCLRSILASDYPKMEILVLDDCSQDSTSDIIKSFSHMGVRFLEGKVPTDSWLAKNHAYQQLLDESEGKCILFCGVDVRFEKSSIRNLVEVMDKQKMISILPTRIGLDDTYKIIQPMRYWRELAIPRIFNKLPPSLGTCWLVERSFLEKLGGFNAFKKSIRPEKHFAKRAFSSNLYSFFRSSSGLGVSSIKNYQSQWQTALRTRYPEHKKRPENIFLFSIYFISIFVAPMIVAVFSAGLNYILPLILSSLAMILLLLTHFLVDQLTNGFGSVRKIIIFPLSVIMEIIAINYSMWAYEFSEVIWKGRNICLPVLRTIPRLPKLR